MGDEEEASYRAWAQAFLEHHRFPFATPPERAMPAAFILDHFVAMSAREPEAFCRDRARATVRERFLAMYLARTMTTLSYPRIAEAFGTDHATVIRACRSVTARCALEPGYAEHVDAIRVVIANSWCDYLLQKESA